MRFLSLSPAVMAGALLLVTAAARAESPPPAAPVKAPAGPPLAAPRAKAAGRPLSRPQRRAKAAALTLAPGTPIATYPSFRLLDDGSTRVAVEVSRKVAITEHKAQGRIVYSLAGVAIPGENTHLPLPTGFFRTPVERLEMVPQSGGADLVIELRETVQPTFRVVDTPRGIVLQVDFPRSAGAPAPPAEGATRPTETRRLEEKASTDD